MIRSARLILACLLPLLVVAGSVTADTLVEATVDATDLPRHLLRCTMKIPVSKSGTVSIWQPQWVPGIHGPSGQIRNVGGLEFFGSSGKRLSWRRDDERLYLAHVQVPKGETSLTAKLVYIANQPTTVSRSVDTYGNSRVLAINFNTCLLYPDGHSARDLKYRLRVKLPTGWKYGTALRAEHEEDDAVVFAEETLEDVIDSPLIAGQHFKTLTIETDGFPPFFMHFVSESPSAVRIDDVMEARFRELVKQCQRLFGSAPFDKYHFLVICSDSVPSFGLEHLQSSFNGIDERDVVDEKKQTGRVAYLLPHEVVHAWCGKYLRPAGMVRMDYHTAKHTKMLWVYEGLTQYLGELLAVRSGLVPMDEHMERLASKIGYLANRAGRKWRSLEDTAITAYTLRGGSEHWGDLRRNQDYYNEGLLFWMEVDALLRSRTEGKRSLDDFCQAFFASPKNEKQPIKPYELDDIVRVLDGLAEYNWRELVRDRIEVPRDQLSFSVIERVGYRIKYTPDQPPHSKRREQESGSISAAYSLGVSVEKTGVVSWIVPGLPADRAGLAQSMQIIGVNDKKFTPQRLRDALADSTTSRHVKFLVLDGETFRTFDIEYSAGPRYITLVPDAKSDDLLKKIFAGED